MADRPPCLGSVPVWGTSGRGRQITHLSEPMDHAMLKKICRRTVDTIFYPQKRACLRVLVSGLRRAMASAYFREVDCPPYRVIEFLGLSPSVTRPYLRKAEITVTKYILGKRVRRPSSFLKPLLACEERAKREAAKDHPHFDVADGATVEMHPEHRIRQRVLLLMKGVWFPRGASVMAHSAHLRSYAPTHKKLMSDFSAVCRDLGPEGMSFVLDNAWLLILETGTCSCRTPTRCKVALERFVEVIDRFTEARRGRISLV